MLNHNINESITICVNEYIYLYINKFFMNLKFIIHYISTIEISNLGTKDNADGVRNKKKYYRSNTKTK